MNRFLLITFTFALFGTFFLSSFQPVEGAVIRRPPNNLGLVAYYPMDEGTGTSAGDFSGNGNDGSFSGNPQWTSGKFGDAVDFDGNGDYIENNNEPVTGRTNITVSAWVRSSASSDQVVVAFGDDATAGGKYTFRIDEDSSGEWVMRTEVNSGFKRAETSVVDGEWHHVVSVLDGSNVTDITHYIDGSSDATDSSSAQNVNIKSVDGIAIGVNLALGAKHFNGQIDDVRIYSRALSASEVADLYNNSAHATRGSTDTTRFTDGLVSHWTFDGPHMTSATATDVHGSNDGTRSGNPVTRIGRLGQALEFDGVDAILSGISYSSSVHTLTFWAKSYDSSSTAIFGRSNGGSHHVGFNNSNLRYRTADDFIDVSAGDIESWHFYAFVRDNTNVKIFKDTTLMKEDTLSGNANLTIDQIGARSVNPSFSGALDDVRIYNKALATSTIQDIYNATRPDTVASSQNSKLTDGLVGMWSFDGPSVSGATISDDSGNSNTGTANGNASPTIGKIGQAFEFDGDGDNVSISGFDYSSNNDFSFSAWFKTYSTQGAQSIISHGRDVSSGGNARQGITVYYTGSGVAGEIADGTSITNISNAAPQNEWVFVATSYISSTGEFTLYVDGEEVNSSNSISGDIIDEVDTIRFGSSWNGNRNYFDGKIDQVRLYNRVLSANEINRLYHLGR